MKAADVKLIKNYQACNELIKQDLQLWLFLYLAVAIDKYIAAGCCYENRTWQFDFNT